MKNTVFACLLALGVLASPAAFAADVIVNEWNAVGSSKYLDGDDFAESTKADSYFGRIQGNGGNWFELVVTAQNVDMRGWEIRWAEEKVEDGDGTDHWYGDGTVDQGILTFSNDAAWSNLQAGTIITISEQTSADVFDLSTDMSFDGVSDWWMHVSTLDEASQGSPLITAVNNNSGVAGEFSVGNDDQLWAIYDASDVEIFRVGEDSIDEKISSKEVAKLEGDPSTSIVGLGEDNGGFYNDGTSSTFGAANSWSGGTLTQDFSALRGGAAVPEPTAALLMLFGACGLLGLRRRG